MHLRDILEGGARSALRIVCAACSQERIAISKAVADSYALPKTSVVFNPVEIERFTDLPSREEACARLGIPFEPGIQTVGMVGRINRWKGHDRFLRVAAAVSKQRNVRFVIAGSPIFRDEDFLPELRRQAHEHGIADRVHFIPWVDDVQNVYAALDVHCNCSLREPFGRSIIEAAAAGVPTICFSDAGAAEVLTNGVNGCVVANGDEAAFARALTFVLESDERLACMKVSARTLNPRSTQRK
jgi:glycosyltransferase involved in cell wall biosynthesis